MKSVHQHVAQVRRRHAPLRGRAEIGLAVGTVINRHKMAKHFALTIADDSFTHSRKPDGLAHEARLNGLYAIRTSVSAETMSAEDAVRAYKDLGRVERAFLAMNRSTCRSARCLHAWLLRRVALARGLGSDSVP